MYGVTRYHCDVAQNTLDALQYTMAVKLHKGLSGRYKLGSQGALHSKTPELGDPQACQHIEACISRGWVMQLCRTGGRQLRRPCGIMHFMRCATAVQQQQHLRVGRLCQLLDFGSRECVGGVKVDDALGSLSCGHSSQVA
jgi:hypothetical protein